VSTPVDHALIAALVEMSPYRRGLRPLVAEIARAAQVCDQVREAVARIAGRAGGAPPTRGALGEDRALIMAFLEHIFFASPAFLAKAGLVGRKRTDV
jgi:hypothetical protein